MERELEEEMEERKEAEAELKRLKEFNENIVQSMDEGIMIEDDEGYITFANPRMLEMVKSTKEELIGKHWSEIFSKEYENEVQKENNLVSSGGKTRYEAALSIEDGEMPVIVSATSLMSDDTYVGNLKVFTDITKRKEAEERLRDQALKYRVEKGGSYLITEKVLDKGLDVFVDILNAGFKGLVMSRTHPERIVELVGEDADVLWMSEKKKGKGVMPPNLSVVLKSIEDFASRDRAILLDRLDYLLVHNEFNDVLKLVQELNELMYLTKSVLIVSLDPDTLDSRELSLFEKELRRIETKYHVEMEKELLDVLVFVKKENDAGRNPAHKDVARTFSITRPTAIKRLNKLKSENLLVDKKKGRLKTLELTRRGREIT
jgi:PAS domain S-box-containing protein